MTTELFEKGLAELKAGNYGEARKLFTQNEEKLGTTLLTRTTRRLELTPEGIHTYGGGYTEYVERTGQEAPGLRG